jgi:putative membrane protein
VLWLVLLRWAVVAVAFAITSWILSGMEVSGGVWGYLWVSALFGIVNAIVGTFLRILTLPFAMVTLGLISLIVNAVLLEITDALTGHLTIDEFWWTSIWAAILIALVTVVLEVGIRMLLARRADDVSRPVAA